MALTKHRIHLHGPKASGAKVSASTLKELLDVLVEGSRRALRLRVEGRSTVKGALPGWLQEGADFEVTGFDVGSSVVQVETRPLYEAAPAQFTQGDFFTEIDTSKSALELFEESLDDVLAENADSDLYDDGLIDVIETFGRVMGTGIDKIELNGKGLRVVEIAALPKVTKLRRNTAPPQHTRVAGKLDAIRHSNRAFTLLLPSGEAVKGIAPSIDTSHLAALFGHDVVVSGESVFRPSGSVLRIEATRVEGASGDITPWAKLPRPVLGALDTRALRQPQGPRSGLSAVFGKWPGDESDDDVDKALAEIS